MLTDCHRRRVLRIGRRLTPPVRLKPHILRVKGKWAVMTMVFVDPDLVSLAHENIRMRNSTHAPRS